MDPTINTGGGSVANWPIAGCEDNITQNGDLDFEGNSYIADWPDGSANHPTPFRYAGPFDKNGDPYPQIQFETNVAASENNSDFGSGNGCLAKPQGAAFYPVWSLGKQSAPTGFPDSDSSEASVQTASVTTGHRKHGHDGACLWNFGNDIKGTTTQDFGSDGPVRRAQRRAVRRDVDESRHLEPAVVERVQGQGPLAPLRVRAAASAAARLTRG